VIETGLPTEPRGQRSPSARERRRGLIVLLTDAFLMWAGFFMVVPLIAVHYVDGLGWSAGAIGLILGVRQATQQGFAFLGGAAADRFGARRLICGGLLIRVFGFSSMAVADSFALLLFSSLVIAAGGALFEAPRNAAIAALTDEGERARYYSLNGVIGGLGLTIGPFVGALLLDVGFDVVALVAGAVFFVAFAVTLVWLPEVRVANAGAPILAGLGLALRDRSFVLFNALLLGFWFIYVQLNISVPLVASEIAGTSRAVSWVYGLNAVMTVVLQYPLLRLAERRLRPPAILALGIGLMAVGLTGLALAGDVPLLLGCIAVFSLGTILATPSQQTVTANLANPVALGSYFGVASLALAVGGGLGNFAGGALYGLGQDLDLPALAWLCFGAIGAATTVGLIRFARAARPTAEMTVGGARTAHVPTGR
jgi:DHA1 family multidrug resistance protein-like MFS transporter